MEPKEANVSTKTLSDATNSIVDPAIQVLDPKERKRQRDKARYAALSEEQKSERRKKQQEAYRRPEAVEKRREARNKKQRESDRKENVDPNDQPAGISANENRVDTLSDMSEVWLHTYDAYTTGLIPPIAPGITSETRVQREPIIDLTENNNTADSDGKYIIVIAPQRCAKPSPARSGGPAYDEQITELKLLVDSLEKERDFYFSKLRDIEILC